MAYPSVILAFGTVKELSASTAVIGLPIWSQPLSAAGVSTAAATAVEPGRVPVFFVQGFVDGYVSISDAPDATVEPRRAVRAGASPGRPRDASSVPASN